MNWLETLFRAVTFVWPFQRVRAWERGVLLFCGRIVARRPRLWPLSAMYPVDGDGTLGPGVYLVIPWLMELFSEDVQPGIVSTPRQDVVLRDGRTLSFSATAHFEIENYLLALTAVQSFRQTMVEELAAIGEILADVDPERFDPSRGKRGRLRTELAAMVDAKTRRYGVRIVEINFPNFSVPRHYRIVMDPSILSNN